MIIGEAASFGGTHLKKLTGGTRCGQHDLRREERAFKPIGAAATGASRFVGDEKMFAEHAVGSLSRCLSFHG